VPIQAALSFPERWRAPLPHLEWTELAGLEFHEPDLERFPCLRLALDAARTGGTACAVLSAANDIAVRAFLDQEIGFEHIPQMISRVLEAQTPTQHPTLEDILAADEWAREEAARVMRPPPTPITVSS